VLFKVFITLQCLVLSGAYSESGRMIAQYPITTPTPRSRYQCVITQIRYYSYLKFFPVMFCVTLTLHYAEVPVGMT